MQLSGLFYSIFIFEVLFSASDFENHKLRAKYFKLEGSTSPALLLKIEKGSESVLLE